MNQERHDIYTITSYVNVRDITLIDNVVYACGYYHNGYDNIACFWSGSTKYKLQGSNYNSYANSMYYDGSKLYIAGSHTDGKSCYYTADLNGNNSLENLYPDQIGGNSGANDICVANNIVYAAVYRSSGSIQTALFWKNHAVEEIRGYDSSEGLSAASICISDDVIYIVGKNHNSAACCWERNINGTLFSPTILSGGGAPTAIFVAQ